MSQRDLEVEETLPLELKLRILESELDRVDSDFQILKERKAEIEAQIERYQRRLSRTRSRQLLRLVK